MSSEVSDMLEALRDGTLSLDQVAQNFREREWPRRRRPPAASYLEMADRAQEDPSPYVPGSFDDVAAAFHRGDLSGDEYRVLSEAVAESKRAEDQRLSEQDSSS